MRWKDARLGQTWGHLAARAWERAWTLPPGFDRMRFSLLIGLTVMLGLVIGDLGAAALDRAGAGFPGDAFALMMTVAVGAGLLFRRERCQRWLTKAGRGVRREGE